MSAYEVALLVATALFVCILLWDNHKIRGRLERSEADIAWLKRAMHNTIEVHQKTMDQHTAGIKRLDEQTGKIAKRLFDHTDSRVAHYQGRLNASMERIQKAQFWTKQAREEAHVVLPNEAADKERPAEGLSSQ